MKQYIITGHTSFVVEAEDPDEAMKKGNEKLLKEEVTYLVQNVFELDGTAISKK